MNGSANTPEAPAKKKDRFGMLDMTTGSPYKLIFFFSVPLLIGSIFQQLYNMVDSIVVGNLIGQKALAAVGTGFPIIFGLSSLFMGVGIGATVMISQYYGAKDFVTIKKTVDTIYTSMMIGSIPLAIIGALVSDPLLRLMKVPDDGTLEMARMYMIVIFVGIIGMIGFNINAGILQGFGDSRTSLLFLAVATVINIVLDLAFTFMGMGTMGVALATVIAQICSWVFGIRFINKHYPFLKIAPLKFHFDRTLFAKAMKLGIPSGIQQAFFAVGVMVLQTLVNSYGSDFMAGFTGANKIDTFAFLPIQSFATAMTTYVGQNVGARKMDRVHRGTKAGLVLAVSSSLVISAAIFPFSGTLMRMFNQNQNVIDAGKAYLYCVLPFYFILALLFVLNAVLRGAGEMIVPMISTCVSLWLARVPTAYLFADLWGKESIYLSYAVGWALGLAITFFFYKTGKWRKKCIISEPLPVPDIL